MAESQDINALLDRRQKIAGAIEKLRTEDREIETALQVLQRYGVVIGTVTARDLVAKMPRLARRPDGVPSLFVMTETVIRDALKAGKPGLKASEIVAEIGKKYWPGVKAQQVLPPIYGYVKKKRLKKGENGIFKPV